MEPVLRSSDIPVPVTRLLGAAVMGRLLTDADTMAGHLTDAGWVRETAAGSWSCPQAPGTVTSPGGGTDLSSRSPRIRAARPPTRGPSRLEPRAERAR